MKPTTEELLDQARARIKSAMTDLESLKAEAAIMRPALAVFAARLRLALSETELDAVQAELSGHFEAAFRGLEASLPFGAELPSAAEARAQSIRSLLRK